jgi:peptidoglycan/LPS O-acetylase OafA/YrhL
LAKPSLPALVEGAPRRLATTVQLPPPMPNSAVRIPALDGLRGIAILLVLMRHTVFGMETDSRLLSPFIAAGRLSWSGVDLFFVLSGFLIGGILLDARESPRYFTTFYLRRFYRIFPLYGVIVAIFLSRHVLSWLLPGPLGQVTPLPIPWLAYVSLTQNFWMAHIGWYGPLAMSVTWSLAVEEQFYLTIPFIIRKIRRKYLTGVLLAIVAGAPVLRTVLIHYLSNGNFAAYVLTPCRADALCMGVLCAVLVRKPNLWSLLVERRIVLRWVAVALFAGLVLMTVKAYDSFSTPMASLGYSWLAVFYACCLLNAVTTPIGWIQRVLCQPWLTRLGTLAYCLYLIHRPLNEVSRRFLAPHFGLPANPAWLLAGLLGVAASLLVASLSWKYFEKPLLRRGHRYTY